MIELTEQQIQALDHAEAQPPVLLNPKTQQAFVLLSLAEYESLKLEGFDSGPWTDEETVILAAEAGELLDSVETRP